MTMDVSMGMIYDNDGTVQRTNLVGMRSQDFIL